MMQWKICQKFLNYEICRFFNNKQVAKFFLTILRQGLLDIYAIAMRMNEKKNSLFWSVCQYRKAFYGFYWFSDTQWRFGTKTVPVGRLRGTG